jgi:hypothetical protein
MSTDGGSRVRRWLGPWLLLIALGVAVATGYGIMRLSDYAAERGEFGALLNRIETDSRHQSALEWQAVAEGQPLLVWRSRSPRPAAWRRLELEAELRVALEQQQFELYYQPILDLDSGTVS